MKLRRMSRRRVRWLGLLGIALGLLAGLWWYYTPRQLRVIARFSHPGHEQRGYLGVYPGMPHVISTAAGLLIDEMPDSGATPNELPLSVTLRDWDGRERWRVEIPGYLPSSQIKASPDGRTLAMLHGDNPGLSMVFWHDGKRTGKTFLPAEMRLYGTFPLELLAVTDAGQAWCRIPYRRDPLVVVDAHGLVARGTAPAPTGSGKRKMTQCYVSPDGTVMATTGRDSKRKPLLEYSTLTIRNGRVVANPRYTLHDSLLTMREQGTLFCNSGDVYGPEGRLLKGKGDPIPSNTINIGVDFFQTITDGIAIQREGEEVFVFPPRARQCWNIPRWADVEDATASRDGQFAFTFETGTRRMPRMLQPFADRSYRLTEWWQRQSSTPRLTVYQSPGRQQARMELHPAGNNKSLFTIAGAEAEYFDGLFLSPDGRRAVTLFTGPESNRRSKISTLPIEKPRRDERPRREFVVLGW